MKELLFVAITTALKAGGGIMKIYERDFTVEEKEDKSPLTEADKISHKIIVTHLHDFPILSEEGKEVSYRDRKNWRKLWIVDPLDGTKEFIKRNGEFTVNIAFVDSGVPVMGVVYAPALNLLYYGGECFGAFKVEKVDFSLLEDITSMETFWNQISDVSISLPVLDERKEVVVVASRSHRNPETEEFIKELEDRFGKVKIISQGSSLKLTAVAEGKADVYPRIAPTMEWDTAAGQAIVEAAGGKVLEYGTEKPLRYNRENLLNHYFVAYRKGFCF